MPSPPPNVYVCPHCVSFSGGIRTGSTMDAVNRWCPQCKRWEKDVAPENPIWECEDGRVLLMSEMETSHIQRCVGMIFRRRNFRGQYMEPLLNELKRRKENAEQGDPVDRVGADDGAAAADAAGP